MEEMLSKYPQGEIVIMSGEGELGDFETYKGKKTVRAITARLKREAAHGDRWAKAFICTGEGIEGNIFVDMLNTADKRYL